MRIPLAVDLKTRAGIPNKDSRLTNCYAEPRGQELLVRKRASTGGAFATGVGQAQGLSFGNATLFSINGDKLTLTTTAPGNPSTSIPNYSGTWLSGVYSWWSVFTFVKPPAPIPLISAADVTALVTNGTYPSGLSNRPSTVTPGVGDFTTVSTAQYNNYDNIGAPDLAGYKAEQASKWATTVGAYQAANALIAAATPVVKSPATVATGVGNFTFTSGAWYSANGYNASGFKSSTATVGAPYPDGTNTVTDNGLVSHNNTVDYKLTGGQQISRTVAHQAAGTLVTDSPATVQCTVTVATTKFTVGGTDYFPVPNLNFSVTGDSAATNPLALVNANAAAYASMPATCQLDSAVLWVGAPFGLQTMTKTADTVSTTGIQTYSIIYPGNGSTITLGLYGVVNTVYSAGQSYTVTDTETDSISIAPSAALNLSYQFYAVQTIINWLILSPTVGFTLTNTTVTL